MTATYAIDEDAFREWLVGPDSPAHFPRWDCRRCPLAAYLRYDTAGAPRVEVGGDGFAVIDGVIGELPRWTVVFTRAFDGPYTNVAPGSRTDALHALRHAIK